MQILTPSGYRDIRDCAIGDEVVYFDTVTGEEKRNVIEGIERFTPEWFQTWVEDAPVDWVESTLDEAVLQAVIDQAVAADMPFQFEGWWYKFEIVADYPGFHSVWYRAAVEGHHVQDEFTFYRINGQFSLFKNQSIWRNANQVCNAAQLVVGDVIFDDTNNDVTITSIELDLTQTEWWRLTISGDHSYIANGLTLHNASRYWVLGTGNWDASTTTNWGSASGTADNASVPTSSDDVHFDAGSNTSNAAYTCTVTVTAHCNDLMFDAKPGDGLGGTITYGGSTVTISGSLSLLSGMTHGGGIITFAATATGKTVTSNAVALSGNVTFNGAGGGWTLQDNFSIGSSILSLTNGTLDTGANRSLSFSTFYAKPGTCSLILNSSSASGNIDLVMYSPTNFTMSGASATFSGSLFNGGIYGPYGTLNGAATIRGANTFSAINLTGSGTTTVDSNLVIGTLTITGTSASARKYFCSETTGTPRTITATAVSLTDVDFTDITGAGAAAPFTGTRLGNAAGNSGITFDAAAPKYYVGNTANWNGTVWALTDGGAAGANNFPLPQDTATFTSNSFSANSQTLTVNGAFRLPGIDFSGMTNRTGITFATGSNACSFYGDLKLTTAGTFAVSGTNTLTAAARTTQTVTSSGVAWTQILGGGYGTTLTFADNCSAANFGVAAGTIGLNSKTLTLPDTNITLNGIYTGPGTFSWPGGGGSRSFSVTSVTSATSVSVNCTYAGGTGTRTITGGSAGVSFNVTAGTDTITLGNFWQIGSINLTGFGGIYNDNGAVKIAGSVTFPAGITYSNTSSMSLNGASGTQVIDAANAGTLGCSVSASNAVQLASNLTLGTTNTFTHSAGTLDLAGKNLVHGRFATSGSTARTITDSVGGGKIATTDTTAATVFDATTTTNLTITRTNPWTIEIGGNTTNIRTMNLGAGKTWPAITFTNTTANGELDIVSSGTATVIKSLAVGTAPQTIKRTAATTISIEDNRTGFPSGAAGSLVTLTSLTAANHTWTKSGGDLISSHYLSISRSTATPAASWYAGTSSTDTGVGPNSGWIFTGPIFSSALTAGLAFVTAETKATSKSLSAAASFIGAIGKALPGIALTGALSFVGATTKLFSGTTMVAALDFVGAFAKLPNKGLSAALAFATAQTKVASKGVSATLSFVGAMGKALPRGFTAALDFAGNIARKPGKTLTGAVSFVGGVSRSVSKGMTATLLLSSARATGGNMYAADGYIIHEFTTVGSHTLQVYATISGAEYLVVAGGGATGGRSSFSGGQGGGAGGAGGFKQDSGLSLSIGSTTVTVGDGGTGTMNAGNNGGNSVLSSIVSDGGGGGGGVGGAGQAGGSGGGAGGHVLIGANPGGTGISGEGYAGGATHGGDRFGAAGGGAGGVGADALHTPVWGQSVGGIGISSSITGTPVTYATGGSFGLGNTIGAANTGNGGSTNLVVSDIPGLAGGSGRVVVRYRGSLVLSVYKTLTGTALPFVGSLSRTAGKPFTAAVSFVGAISRAVGKVLTSALSFIAAQTKATTHSLAPATLSFIAILTKSISSVPLTAALSFVGSIVRKPGKAFAPALSFIVTQNKAIARHLTAALSFFGFLFNGFLEATRLFFNLLRRPITWNLKSRSAQVVLPERGATWVVEPKRRSNIVV